MSDKSDNLTERDIQRALYWKHRSAMLVLPNYTPSWMREESDLFVVTQAGYTIDYEIKRTRSDYRRDFCKVKHANFRCRELPHVDKARLVNRFAFAVPDGMVSPNIVPDYAGLVYVRRCASFPGAEIIVKRRAPRLSSERLSDGRIRDMASATCRRFWAQMEGETHESSSK